MTRFTDALIHDGRLRTTDDGVVVQARVARGDNVQAYLGSELGGPFADKAVVRVYRPADEVFHREAVQTYARKPITLGHPPNGVTDETWKDLAVGEIDRDVVRDGEFVSVPLLFRDAKAIALLRSADGPRELSMGYDAQVTARDGTSPSGEPYDAVMGGFKMNHVAVVTAARGGKELRIGDADKWGASPVHDAEKEVSMTLRTIMVDGLSVETTDAGAQAIDKLKKDIAAKDAAVADAATAHKDALDAKDREIAAKDAEIEELKKAQLSDADLDARVQARAKLIGDARAVAPDLTTDGLPDAAIRKAAAEAAGLKLDGKSDAYIEARFDALVEAAGKKDAVADALSGGTVARVGDLKAQAEKAWEANNQRLADAWKGDAAAQH